MRDTDTHGLFGDVRTRSKQLLAAWIIILTGLIGVLAASGTAQATAGINNTLNFQGRLLNAAGAVVPDGNYNMEFRIYQDGTGTAAYNGGTYASPTGLDWSEDWLDSNSQGVVVKNGYFSVNLGSICTFAGSTCQGQVNSAVNWNDNTLWLSMDVAGPTETTASCGATQALFHQTWNGTNGCSADGEMLPMRAMTTSVYAENAEALTGPSGLLTASSFIQNTVTPQSGGANIDYVSAATGNVGAQIQSAASGTAAVLVLKDNTSSTGDLLQLQPSGSTTPLARFDDNGNLYVASTIDSQTSGGSLSIGPTNATGGISLGQNTTVATGKTLTVTSGTTTLTGTTAGSAIALSVHAGADTNKGLVVYGNSATQSGNLLELDNSSGVAQTSFDASGDLTTNGTLHSGTTSSVGGLILKDGNANAYTVTLQSQNQAETYTLTLPTDGTSGTNCLQSTSGSVNAATVLQFGSCGSSTGANQSLSNLTSPTAINQDLTFAAATHQLNITQASSGVGNNLSVVAGEGATGSTGGNLLLEAGANGTSAGTPGSVIVKANGGDSTTAFMVQDAAGNTALNVDTTANTLTVGSTSTWTSTTVVPATPGAMSSATAVAYSGYAYVFGGTTGTCCTADLEYAAISSTGIGAWTTVSSGNVVPVAADEVGAATANGYAYLMTGSVMTTGDTAAVYYTKLSNTGGVSAWTSYTSGASEIGQTEDSASGASYNGYIYLVGGAHAGAQTTNVYYTQPNTSTGAITSWTSYTGSAAGALPVATQSGSAVASNGYIYYVGGVTSGGSTQAAYMAPLNASTGAVGTWTIQPSLPSGCGPNGGNLIASGGSLFWVTGNTGATYYDTVCQATVANNGTISGWTQLASTVGSTGIDFATAVAYNGYGYVMGGYTGSTRTTATYYASLTGTATTYGYGTTTLNGKLIVENNTPSPILTVDPTGADAFIGAGSAATDTTADLLVLDNQASATSTDPTEVNGAMYYNSALGAFRCGIAGAWTSCVNGAVTSLVTVPGVASTGAAIGAANHIWVAPIYVPGPMTINDFYLDESTTITVGDAGDVGLYNSSGTKVLDGGSSSLTTGTGLKTIAPTQTGSARNISAGQYYLAWTTNAAAGAVFSSAFAVAGELKYCGTLSSGGGLVLPATITLASITASVDYDAIGISN